MRIPDTESWLLVFVVLLLSISALFEAAVAADDGETLLLQQPTISAEHIVFAYAQDPWIVGRAGGDARRLTSHVGRESHPRFSSDEKWIAFSGEYERKVDATRFPSPAARPRG